MKAVFFSFILLLAIGGEVRAAQFSRPYFERDAGPSARLEPAAEKPVQVQAKAVKQLKIKAFEEHAPIAMLTPAFQVGQPFRIARVLPPKPPVVEIPLLPNLPPPVVSRDLNLSREAEPPPPPISEVVVTGTTRLVYPGRKTSAVPEPVITGEGRVTIRNTTTATATFHLALAQNGVALIEFPASDGFAIVHPGNPDLVTIDEASRQPHAPLVLRPGSGFVGGSNNPPTALVVVQMRSGLICSLFIHPAPTVKQNANVVHVSYDPSEIVEVRRKAGFASEIKEKVEPKPVPVEPAPEPKRVRAVPVPPDPLEELLRENRFGPAPSNTPKAARNGLELSVADGPSLDDRTGTFIVRVRNASARGLRLIDAQPALAVRTFGPRGELIQEEALTELKRLSEKATGLIESGETRVFVVSFRIPVLGVRQRLAVSIAHATAADEPVAVVIGGPVSEKKNEKKGKD